MDEQNLSLQPQYPAEYDHESRVSEYHQELDREYISELQDEVELILG